MVSKFSRTGNPSKIQNPLRRLLQPMEKCKTNEEATVYVYDPDLFLTVQIFEVLSLDELETLRKSRNSTTVVTAKREVQTNEKATVYVHDLELFVTVQILEGTLAVLSPGKLCEQHSYSYEWTSGQKPQLTKKWANNSV